MIRVRRFLTQDYKEVCTWWKDQGRVILALQTLPTLGFLVEDEEGKIAVAWLYVGDSVTGFIGWTTVNPKVKKRKMSQALSLLDEAMEMAGKQLNVRLLFRFSGGGGFSRKLVKLGWTHTVVKHDFLMKEI